MKIVGLMSGTSMDGIDAALMEIRGTGIRDGAVADMEWKLLAFVERPYPTERRTRLRMAVEDRATTADLCRLHADLGAWLAEAVLEACERAGVDPSEIAAVGSHGHTVWHEPPGEAGSGGIGPDGAGEGASLQIGSPAVLAERTGIPVVSDFRSRDVAAGGHGAPLVPFADRLLFSTDGRRRAIQNLGGMANVTLLPARGEEGPVLAFDTGPGVALLDAAAEMATDGRRRYDEDGRLASSAAVDEDLLARLLEIPFLDREPPRSTGRELFGTPMVESLARDRGLIPGRDREEWAVLLATLTAFTARTVGDAFRRWVVPRGVDEVFLTGGGARNPALREALERELAPLPIRPAEALGLDPDAREAAAFAVLAWAHLKGLAANVPEATGAGGGRVLGSLTPGAVADRIDRWGPAASKDATGAEAPPSAGTSESGR